MLRKLMFNAAALVALTGALTFAGCRTARAAEEDINAWGKPDFEQGDAAKVGLWRDDDGWHIRWTTAGKKRKFSGYITASGGEFTKIQTVKKERGDWAAVTGNDKRLLFSTETDGGVDGFDFRTDSPRLSFTVVIDGKEHPDRVFIGKNNRNPASIPFTLEKWDSQPRGDGKPDAPKPDEYGVGGGAPAAAAEDINAWGKPDFEKGDVMKVALWRDDDGWHLRWTTAGHKHKFAGWVRTPGGEFTQITFVRKERSDWAAVKGNDKRLWFSTETDGGVDGFDFRTDSPALTFSISIDGKEVTDRIFIGKNDRNPKANPFTLEKWESQPRGDRERDRKRGK